MDLPPPRPLSMERWKEVLRKNPDGMVYEIEVPLKDNLYWSILISYLLLEEIDKIFSFIKDLERDGFLSTAFDYDGFFDKLVYVYPDLKKLPEDSEIINVFNAFKNKLNRSINKNKLNRSSDYMTINIAAEMLKCNIYVILPEELQIIPDEHDNLGNLSIIILLYKDKNVPDSNEKIDVFRSVITSEYSKRLVFAKFLNYNRNLQVRFFLKDAKYPTEIVDSMTLFLENNDVCGKKFLPELIKSDNIDLFKWVYKFPDITKILEVGNLVTNPINASLDKSPFALAAAKPNTEYIRMLYYYSANFCYLFEDIEPSLSSYPHLDCFGALRSLLEKSVLNPNEAILENLKKIQEIFQSDISMIDKHDTKKKDNPTLRTLEEFSRLNKCQNYSRLNKISIKKILINLD